MKVLVTGATGFIGQAVVTQLLGQNHQLIATTRSISSAMPTSVKQIQISSMSSDNDWSEALQGVSKVVHLAARAHVLHEQVADPLAEFRKVNTNGTLHLAREAAKNGVERFIFLSSIGVNGNSSNKPFTELDIPNPAEDYAVSKYEAEKGLLEISHNTAMEVVIIRPPLVYGPNAPGNFANLLKWVKKGVPLPFAAVDNKRSFIALDNLVNFIIDCLGHSKAANEIFVISDDEDVSTTQLLQKVGEALGKSAWLIPIPVGLMRAVASFLGKGDVARRLFGTLQVDSSKAKDMLGWRPVVTMEEQLKTTAEAWLKGREQGS